MAEPLDATLRRLKQERDEADRRYNDALTALDRSFGPAPCVPAAPRAYDDHQISPLNDSWNILPQLPDVGGLTGRLRGLVWRTIGPYLQRQLTFNSQLVDHLNRNVAAHREASQAAETLIALMRDHLAAQEEFQSRLLLLLQQVTAYVDTKDRETGGGALVLNASLSALGESFGKRWESMAVREQRFESRTAALAADQRDLRAAIGVSQQAALAVKRELERMLASGPHAAVATAPVAAPDTEAFATRLDAYKYVGFEDQFRGSREAIRSRLESYVPFFEEQSDVLDVGCGRGEFLELLALRGIGAIGIDLNLEMVEVSRSRGLHAEHGDGVGYLSSCRDESIGGIFAAQVVEHLQPGYLLRFLELSFHKLRPGGTLVLETLNPACWVAFFESYIRDITHVWPLHPETLKYLVTASGFPSPRIEYRSPVPPQDRLQPIASGVPGGYSDDFVETFNANIEKLNARMFTYLDYAIVAEKQAACET